MTRIILVQKKEDLIGIQTQIVGIEGKNADHEIESPLRPKAIEAS